MPKPNTCSCLVLALDGLEWALVLGRVPATGRATVGARPLSPWVPSRLVRPLPAGDILPLNADHTILDVSKLLVSPQGDVTAGGKGQQGKGMARGGQHTLVR